MRTGEGNDLSHAYYYNLILEDKESRIIGFIMEVFAQHSSDRHIDSKKWVFVRTIEQGDFILVMRHNARNPPEEGHIILVAKVVTAQCISTIRDNKREVQTAIFSTNLVANLKNISVMIKKLRVNNSFVVEVVPPPQRFIKVFVGMYYGTTSSSSAVG